MKTFRPQDHFDVLCGGEVGFDNQDTHMHISSERWWRMIPTVPKERARATIALTAKSDGDGRGGQFGVVMVVQSGP